MAKLAKFAPRGLWPLWDLVAIREHKHHLDFTEPQHETVVIQLRVEDIPIIHDLLIHFIMDFPDTNEFEGRANLCVERDVRRPTLLCVKIESGAETHMAVPYIKKPLTTYMQVTFCYKAPHRIFYHWQGPDLYGP
jgi:hypothetical protein